MGWKKPGLLTNVIYTQWCVWPFYSVSYLSLFILFNIRYAWYLDWELTNWCNEWMNDPTCRDIPPSFTEFDQVVFCRSVPLRYQPVQWIEPHWWLCKHLRYLNAAQNSPPSAEVILHWKSGAKLSWALNYDQWGREMTVNKQPVQILQPLSAQNRIIHCRHV